MATSDARVARVRNRTPTIGLLAVALCTLAACATFQSDGAGASSVADTPPAPLQLAAHRLTDSQGQWTTLEALVSQHQALLLVFWSAGCPCVRRYQDRILELQQDFEPRGVRVLAVGSNADETAESLANAAAERSLMIPLLFDPQGAVAMAVQAKSTPTVVIITVQGQLVYRGWIDNERRPGEDGRIAYAEHALARLLGGETSFFESSRVYGCRITKSLTPATAAATHPVPACAPGADAGASSKLDSASAQTEKTGCGCSAGAAAPPMLEARAE